MTLSLSTHENSSLSSSLPLGRAIWVLAPVRYKAYSRNHEISGAKKAAAIQAPPILPSAATRPATIPKICWWARSRLVTCFGCCICAPTQVSLSPEYSDEAVGEMLEHPDGSGEFKPVTLRPRMTITDASRTADALAANHKAHEMCFLARSMNFPVQNEPTILHPTVGA